MTRVPPARGASADAPRTLAVLDIDGVLADVGHRLAHVLRRPKDWDAFFAAMAEDPVLPEGRDLALQLAAEHDVVYLTGRPARYADVTRRWLDRHGLPPGPVVHRRDGDRRPARVAKAALLRAVLARADVHVVVDDDESVCAAYRELGVDVLHATWAVQPESAARRLHEEQERGHT